MTQLASLPNPRLSRAILIGTMSPVIEQRELEVRGSAVIASSPKNAKSHSPVGRRHTAFTGQMVELLKNGSPNDREPLTVLTLFDRIHAGPGSR